MTEQPNILWICTDQQRWDTLGCYGNPFVNTPNLNNLSANGAHFENAFCQSPVCTPSRASFLTGRYPRTTRCRQNGQETPDDEILVTRILAESGYHCGLAGKFHLSPCNPTVCPTHERRIKDGYAEFNWSHHSGPGWETNAYHKWLKGKGKIYAESPHPESNHVCYGPEVEDHQTTWCAEMAIEFINRRAQEPSPWLYSVNFFDPHHPFDAPESTMERYEKILLDIPLPDYREGELEDKPTWQKREHAEAYGGYPFKEMSDYDHRLVRASCYAMCDLIDQQVGRMLEALKNTGQSENTIVIFMSDHGEMLGDHGIYLKGAHFYEPAVHVPLIVSQPGMIPSRRIVDLVELTDLAPTLLDAANLPKSPGMQGKSLWPLLSGQISDNTLRHRQSIYSEYYNAMPAKWSEWKSGIKDPLVGDHATMLRTEKYKIIVPHGEDHGELYNIIEDPSEQNNLWSQSAYLQIKVELMKMLIDRMAFTVDPLPERKAVW